MDMWARFSMLVFETGGIWGSKIKGDDGNDDDDDGCRRELIKEGQTQGTIRSS